MERRELARQLLLSLPPEAGVHELRETLQPYDRGGPTMPAARRKEWTALTEFRAQLGVPTLETNPVLDLREEERF